MHEALDEHAPPDHCWRPVLDAVAPRSFVGHADALSDVPDYELFRAAFSRRSRAQMAAWSTGLDQETLDAMCLFGPRDDDQPIPADN